MHKKTTIIFDFDGTIANSFDFFVNFFHNEILKLGNDISKDEIKILIRNKRIFEIGKEYKISKLKYLYLYYRFKKDFSKIKEKVKLFPDIKKLLIDLDKEYNLVLLTSNDKQHIEKTLKRNRIMHCFNEIYYKSSLRGKSKYLKKIIKNHKLKKDEVVYIGDELRDFESCQKAGIDCINVSYGFNSRKLLEIKNKLVVDRVKHLRDLLL